MGERSTNYGAFKENWSAEQARLEQEGQRRRLEHERASQKYLANAEQAQSGQDLYQLFLQGEFWDHQIDLINLVRNNHDQKNFDFLTRAAADSQAVDKQPGGEFFEHQDFIPRENGTAVAFNFYDSKGEYTYDYEEYVLRILSKSLGEYEQPEFRAKAEDSLILILKRMQTKEREYYDQQRSFYAIDEKDQQEIDYVSGKDISNIVGYSDEYFNATYATVIEALARVGSGRSIKAIVELTNSKPVELLGVMTEALSKLSSEKSTKAVFAKYGEIIDQTNLIGEFMSKQFGKQDVDPVQANRIGENLLKRGNELVQKFADDPDKDPEKIIEDLERVKTEVLLFASTFKVANEEKPLDFSEVQGVEINIKDSGELSAEDKKQMMEIYKGNRAGYEEKRLAETVKEFEGVLASKGKEFNLLTHNGELLAFIRFDKLPNGNLRAGSLNVRPEARNSQIGMALLRATLDKKAETHNIEAEAWSKLPMLKHYTGDFGFQIAGEMPNYHGQEMYYRLFRPKQ